MSRWSLVHEEHPIQREQAGRTAGGGREPAAPCAGTMIQQHANDSLVRTLGHSHVLLEHLNQSSVFCSRYREGRWYCSLLLALYALALPVGVLGNVAALLNYTCFRRAWTASSVFLLNLALCDSAWILTLPFSLYFSLQTPSRRDAQTFCQFKRVSFNISVYGSILFLTLVSFDRYAGTVHPLGSLRWWGVGRARLCSCAVWALLLLGLVPDLLLAFAVRRPGDAGACMDHIQGPFAYVVAVSVARTALGFAVPFGLMLAFYAMTARALRGRRPPRGRGGGGRGRRASRPLALISAAVLVFVVSFVPYHAMVVTLVFMRVGGLVTAGNVSVLHASCELLEALCCVSGALDPLLYILASERFQRRRPGCCRRSHRVGGEG
ncbi:hypothetical protein AAFF_G00260580 [Aldrovandia affinis]|uniref:G-protein coupled receptors family 1 profile domain-containing protein n=1 Tax=Aldrovandia affinis TaxID=143900 RepID=A0AAD7RC66_9TELE|nr:hypothetical protein AAFF_G00260580 [Aldrovandia affinis]